MEERVAEGQMEKARLPLAANPTVQAAVSTKEWGTAGKTRGGAPTTDLVSGQEFEIAGQRGARIGIALKSL